MAGNKKINKAKARATVIATYEVLAGMDGNPITPKEFDESPHSGEELFFKADDDATQVCTITPSPVTFLSMPWLRWAGASQLPMHNGGVTRSHSSKRS